MPRPNEAHLAIAVASDNLDNFKRQQLLGDLNFQANVQRQKGKMRLPVLLAMFVQLNILNVTNMTSKTGNLISFLPLHIGLKVKITKKLLPPEIVQIVAGNRHGIVWFHRGPFFVPTEMEARLNQTLTQSKHRKPGVSGWTAQPQTLGTDSQGTQMARMMN